MKPIKLTRTSPLTTNGSMVTYVNMHLVSEFSGVEGGGTVLLFDSRPDGRAQTIVEESPDYILSRLDEVYQR